MPAASPCTGLGMPRNVTVSPSVGSGDPHGHQLPLQNRRQFGTATRSPPGARPHYPVQFLPLLLVYSHCPESSFPPQHLLYHPPNPPPPTTPQGATSGTTPEPGGHTDHHPAPLWGGQSCVVNPKKGLGWDKMAMITFFRYPPNSGTLAQLWPVAPILLPAPLQALYHHQEQLS